MCLILFGYQVCDQYPLVLAANRDEFHQRPTKPMHDWADPDVILAGKDLEQNGTWFGINKKTGRFAALTNFREPSHQIPNAPSRGQIIVDSLMSPAPVSEFLHAFHHRAHVFNGFNLLIGDVTDLFWYCNINGAIEKITPGIHGLSNRFLDTPWPKVTSGKKALKKALARPLNTKSLFSILTCQQIPDDSLLPDTGVGLAWERMLSPLFIRSPEYGTRSSTLLVVDQHHRMEVIERTWDKADPDRYSDLEFVLTPSTDPETP